MKKLSALMYAFIAVTLLFSSCGGGDEEDPIKPTITTDATDKTVEPGAKVAFKVTVQQGSEKLSKITVRESTAQIASDRLMIEGKAATNSEYSVNENKTLDIEITAPGSAGVFYYSVQVVDKKEQTNNIEFTLTVAQAKDAKTYTAKLLGNNSNKELGSYMEVATGTVYLTAGAVSNSDKIDFAYFHGLAGGANEATIAAPSDAATADGLPASKDLATKNATKFLVLSGVDFSTLKTTNDVNAALAGKSMTATKANKLAKDSVVAFETVGGIKGIFKVISITGSNSESGEIEIDIITNVAK